MKICFMPSDFDGVGCYRCLYPARELRKLGYDTAMPPYRTEELENGDLHIEFSISESIEADLYVMQQRREVGLDSLIKGWKGQGAAVVAETDDWYLGVPPSNRAHDGLKPYRYSYRLVEGNVQVIRERKNWSVTAMLQGLSAADAVTVTTPFLAEKYSKYNRNIHVLRNYLDWEMWEKVKPVYEREWPRVRIGYMGSLSVHGGDVGVLRGVIGPFLEKHGDVDFVAAGDEGIHDFIGVPEDQRISIPPVHFRDQTLPSMTAHFDIGLVPLEDIPFNEAKSHLKGMEYAACGIPCVASNTESYRDYWVGDREIGFIAKRPKDWINHLELLVTDHELRRSMGKKAREFASEHTIQKHIGEWEEVYNSL